MHKITKPDGSFLTVEKFHYIRRHKNGSLVICEKRDAEGVAHNGAPYMFADGCHISEVDGGDVLASQMTALNGIIKSILEG